MFDRFTSIVQKRMAIFLAKLYLVDKKKATTSNYLVKKPIILCNVMHEDDCIIGRNSHMK